MPGVIRRERAPTFAEFSFDDLAQRAQAITDDARRRAAEIVAQASIEASTQAEAVRELARREGLEQGRREGAEQVRREAADAAMHEARQRLDGLAKTLEAAVAGFDEAKYRLLAEAETGLIRVALAVARRVCKIEAGRASDVAVANARALLEMIRGEHDLELCVSRCDYDALHAAIEPLARTIGASAHCRVRADDALSAGDCVLHGRSGEIDASLDVQLDRLSRALTGAADDVV